jgi:hypothetical protein
MALEGLILEQHQRPLQLHLLPHLFLPISDKAWDCISFTDCSFKMPFFVLHVGIADIAQRREHLGDNIIIYIVSVF